MYIIAQSNLRELGDEATDRDQPTDTRARRTRGAYKPLTERVVHQHTCPDSCHLFFRTAETGKGVQCPLSGKPVDKHIIAYRRAGEVSLNVGERTRELHIISATKTTGILCERARAVSGCTYIAERGSPDRCCVGCAPGSRALCWLVTGGVHKHSILPHVIDHTRNCPGKIESQRRERER
jgi:hypothetical protein